MNGGAIFVFTGTSGAGRKTVARRVSEAMGLKRIVSATTRKPRNPARPDNDYHYITPAQFAALERDGAFLQTVEIDGNRYGVLQQEVDSALAAGYGISLVLNREGTEAVKRRYGERVIRIFIYVDKKTVRERLESKGAGFAQIELYLNQYADEVTYRKQCEHVFENVDLNSTVDRIIQSLKR